MAEGYSFSISKIMKLLNKIKNKVEIVLNKMCWIPFTTWKSSYQFFKKNFTSSHDDMGLNLGLESCDYFEKICDFFLQNHIISSQKI